MFIRALDAMRAISIHAPREGSDRCSWRSARWPPDFYPRSPRGERHDRRGLIPRDEGFLSTLPARGATVRCKVLQNDGWISIHAPREGSDGNMVQNALR